MASVANGPLGHELPGWSGAGAAEEGAIDVQELVLGKEPALPQDVAASRCAVFVDEWVRSGVRHAVVCPGSRSAPIALALAADRRIEVHVRLDERSAGFVAVGIGMATGVPAVLCTTSGTATAEVHAAVVEAHHGGVPLLVWTADRPSELHDVGAPQTIEQGDLFGPALRWSCGVEVADLATAPAWRSLASRAVAETMWHPAGPGPVHVNMALREPLLGRASVVIEGRGDGAPWHQVGWAAEPDPSLVAADLGFLGLGETWVPGIVVAGAGCGDPDLIHLLAHQLQWPLLADPRSGCRRAGPAVVVGTADGLVRCAAVASALRPAAILRIGAPWASKELGQWLDALVDDGIPQVLVSNRWPWVDPGRRAPRVAAVEPTRWCRTALDTLGAEGFGGTDDKPDPGFAAQWGQAESAAQQAIDRWLEIHGEPTEPGVARTVSLAAGGGATVLVGSSMPVRDLEWFGAVRRDAPAVQSNRGANGIDGMVSTAMGIALTGRPVVAVVGDLGFLHDLTAWVRPPDEMLALTVVVVDNGGGGIFSFLPQASGVDPASFERLFSTPQAVDVARVAGGLGVTVVDAGTLAEVAEAVRGTGGAVPGVAGGDLGPVVRVVRVRVPAPAVNVALHQSLQSDIAGAARAALQ